MDNMETNEQQQNSQQKQGENSQKQIAGAILLAAVIIGGSILLKGNRPPVAPAPIAENGVNKENIEIRPVSKEDHIKGDARAKIIIVEYSDLECPFCKVFHETMNQVMETNKNIAWVYRHYPIPMLHSKALKEALATECAWEQGGNTAFWQYTDKIFEITTSNDGLDLLELPKIAKSLGLNVDSFNSCLSSEKFKSKILDEIENASKAGVRGTPKSFILKNSKVVDTIDGAQPLKVITEKIEKALK